MNLDRLIKRILKEATSDSSGGRGSYIAPLQPGIRKFVKTELDPFNIEVSKYDSPFLEYDSYDGSMETPKKQIKKLEKQAKKITNKITKNPNLTFSDDDGNNINQTPGRKLRIVPIDIDVIKEDLAVWFGKKKKPKGSSQPKGPWVDICRRVDGKHPPCGRKDADKGSYPKCRAAGVAGKMSDSQKKAACQQKRKAEKNDPQRGKGQKPVMTSYNTKKESIDSLVGRIISEIRNSF